MSKVDKLKNFAQSQMVSDTKGATSRWLQRNVDFAFFLAAFTETPRWTVAFMAIHEPMWVGIPLGVLLAFATAKAWRKFFVSRDWRLFWFNVASIVIAVMVIAPVLFAQSSGHDVDLSVVLGSKMLWVWATVLALTTFIPLVQLAACDDRHTREPEGGNQNQTIDIYMVVARAIEEQLRSTPIAQLETQTQVKDVALEDEPESTDTQLDYPEDTTVAIINEDDTQSNDSDSDKLDDLDADIISAVNGGADTVYAISKATGKPSTTLRRKDGSGRLPKLVARGCIDERNGKYYPTIALQLPRPAMHTNGVNHD